MMEYEKNPFQELYVTDSPDPNVFVRLFSDHPIRHAQMLFQPGNVVLKGSQGSGKSMLLNLFRPQIRLAYHMADVDFPVPDPSSNFIGAGINLTRSGVLNIGQRPLRKDPKQELHDFPLYFADFLNYYIVRDILETLHIQAQHVEVFRNLVNTKGLEDFAIALSNDPCWFEALSGCKSLQDICQRIDSRIKIYRKFHNNFDYEIPNEVHGTKTDIGEPIARTVDHMKDSGVVPGDTPVFVRIDQIERLYHSDVIRRAIGQQYRRTINKALGKRDLRVSYRVGTRHYAWDDDLYMFGTDDKLEVLRDFRILDIDYIQRRREDPKTWIFPGFAEDVFVRRLIHAGYKPRKRASNLIGAVFGPSPKPEEAARKYAGTSPAKRIVKIEDTWPDEWKDFLEMLFKDDPLEAVLAGGWVRQRGVRGRREHRLDAAPPKKDRPWNRQWWRKERAGQALVQIAARAPGRLKWTGKKQIIALSAGNISIFLSICFEVWEAFLRSERNKKADERSNPVHAGPINPDIQAVGIHTASTVWYEKMTEQPKGDDRQRFIDVLGRTFRRWLVDDTAMSYPGHNGFSIANEDIKNLPMLAEFLNEAVDYGDLYDARHTTKKRDRRQRTKWYLNPILSAYFQIPESHGKEPYYLEDIGQLVGWIKEAEVFIEGLGDIPTRWQPPRKGKRESEGPTLFDHVDGVE